MRAVQKQMFTHHRASHKLIFEFICQHPLGQQKSLVSSTPVEPVKTIGFAFLLIESWLWRANKHGDALDHWTKRETYFFGKDSEISCPWRERWRKVHKSASSHLISEARASVRASERGTIAGGSSNKAHGPLWSSDGCSRAAGTDGMRAVGDDEHGECG